MSGSVDTPVAGGIPAGIVFVGRRCVNVVDAGMPAWSVR